MNCTIDASVFVAAARVEEKQHAVSLAFLGQAQQRERGSTIAQAVTPQEWMESQQGNR